MKRLLIKLFRILSIVLLAVIFTGCWENDLKVEFSCGNYRCNKSYSYSLTVYKDAQTYDSWTSDDFDATTTLSDVPDGMYYFEVDFYGYAGWESGISQLVTVTGEKLIDKTYYLSASFY
tara:strand:+ start:276 stop:632 length:357 start_codon:yes stop_codon:yes gene_type:complete